jgi:hypothetical protein
LLLLALDVAAHAVEESVLVVKARHLRSAFLISDPYSLIFTSSVPSLPGDTVEVCGALQ